MSFSIHLEGFDTQKSHLAQIKAYYDICCISTKNGINISDEIFQFFTTYNVDCYTIDATFDFDELCDICNISAGTRLDNLAAPFSDIDEQGFTIAVKDIPKNIDTLKFIVSF
jgi:hypothetical protein